MAPVPGLGQLEQSGWDSAGDQRTRRYGGGLVEDLLAILLRSRLRRGRRARTPRWEGARGGRKAAGGGSHLKVGTWVSRRREIWGHLLPGDHGQSLHSSCPPSSVQAKSRPGLSWEQGGAGWELDRSGVEPRLPSATLHNQTNSPTSQSLRSLIPNTEAATLRPTLLTG